MEIKVCSRCKTEKYQNEFSSNKSQRDGLNNQCLVCTRKSGKEYKLRIKEKTPKVKVEILDKELFLPVVFDGIQYEYLISNMGRLISLKDGKEKLMNPTKEPGKCGRPGYLSTSLRHPDKSHHYSVRVHRLVAIAFIDNPENLPQVNHIDGNKSNNNSLNLEWCDSLMNIRHSFETGLNIAKKGQESHNYNKGTRVILNGVIYNSVAQCARDCGVPRTSLSSELDGRMKTKIGIRYVD